MKIYRIVLLLTLMAVSSINTSLHAQAGKISNSEYYQIRIYHTSSQPQLDSLSDYLQHRYVPALHKSGHFTVGVFFPQDNNINADKRIIVWMPLNDLNQLGQVSFSTAAPHYQRMENIILSAFPKAPHYKVPHLTGNRTAHIFELRSYESPDEERYLSKEKMFNLGNEVDLFARLQFNAVFYARVIAGSRMPNLMYMTSFSNQQAHDEHWKTFNEDAEWKRLSGLPEYQKNVNKADIILMNPAPYSDIF